MDWAEPVREPNEGNPCAQFGAGNHSCGGSLLESAPIRRGKSHRYRFAFPYRTAAILGASSCRE
jgi:hypothetical protein